MNRQQETAFINKFIDGDKKERYLTFLLSSRNRKKFTDKLYHFQDFKWDLLRLIQGEHEKTAILNKLKEYKNIDTCAVISTDKRFDGTIMLTNDALDQVVSIEGTILIFGNADVIYYEGEAPNRRYISK